MMLQPLQNGDDAAVVAAGSEGPSTTQPVISVPLRKRSLSATSVSSKSNARQLKQFSLRVNSFAADVASDGRFVEAAERLSARAIEFLLVMRPFVIQILHNYVDEPSDGATALVGFELISPAAQPGAPLSPTSGRAASACRYPAVLRFGARIFRCEHGSSWRAGLSHGLWLAGRRSRVLGH